MFDNLVRKPELLRSIYALFPSVREHGSFLAVVSLVLVFIVVGISLSDQLYDRYWRPTKVTTAPMRPNWREALAPGAETDGKLRQPELRAQAENSGDEPVEADDGAFDRIATALLQAEMKQQETYAATSQALTRNIAEHDAPHSSVIRSVSSTAQQGGFSDELTSRVEHSPAAVSPARLPPGAMEQIRGNVAATQRLATASLKDEMRGHESAVTSEHLTSEEQALSTSSESHLDHPTTQEASFLDRLWRGAERAAAPASSATTRESSSSEKTTTQAVGRLTRTSTEKTETNDNDTDLAGSVVGDFPATSTGAAPRPESATQERASDQQVGAAEGRPASTWRTARLAPQESGPLSGQVAGRFEETDTARTALKGQKEAPFKGLSRKSASHPEVSPLTHRPEFSKPQPSATFIELVAKPQRQRPGIRRTRVQWLAPFKWLWLAPATPVRALVSAVTGRRRP